MGFIALTYPVRRKKRATHGGPWAGRRRKGWWKMEPSF